jgi:hypothetical protein
MSIKALGLALLFSTGIASAATGTPAASAAPAAPSIFVPGQSAPAANGHAAAPQPLPGAGLSASSAEQTDADSKAADASKRSTVPAGGSVAVGGNLSSAATAGHNNPKPHDESLTLKDWWSLIKGWWGKSNSKSTTTESEEAETKAAASGGSEAESTEAEKNVKATAKSNWFGRTWKSWSAYKKTAAVLLGGVTAYVGIGYGVWRLKYNKR